MRGLTRYLLGVGLVGVALVGCSDTETTNTDTEDIQVTEEVNPSFVEPEVTAQEDVPLVEPGDLPEPEPECEPGAGCFGEPCSDSDDCLSGICGEHMGEGACTETCDEACPEGWSCSQVSLGSSDTTFICVSDHTHLCRPCGDVADCAGDGAEDACVLYPGEGAFCGSTCDDDRPCPEGFSCVESELTSGGTSAQCVADAGVCPCSDTAIELGLSTPCEVTNDIGTCEGLRICGPQGLGACDAPEPAPETCDGVDQDCDGEVDEDTCDDGNPCTVDVCGGESGCTNEPITDVACDDGNACTTGDACQAGVCVGAAVECQDGNPCTDDACDEVFGCSFEPNGAPCDDGDPCTLADACEDSACQSGVSIQCDDGNPCTDDACDESQGCLHTPNTESCDDQNACTQGDTCSGGACISAGLVDCDDGEFCTTDSCAPATGCVSVPNTLPCDDADVCTLTDACAGGVCVAGNDLECDDGNPCTTDVCNPITGCQHTLNAEPCDDGDPCTADDQCAGGVCAASQPLDCGDGNPCTTDVCVPFAGCSYEPNTAPCDDEDVCTVGDVCGGNSCVSGGQVLGCDDGNPCTDDVCDPLAGCIHTPNQDGCDDL
ncbi:MAG: hypothetical protein VX938_05985, partial [Myxococcota bacterium]|nr:hypothetical protein [Myxococcota bacterium]